MSTTKVCCLFIFILFAKYAFVFSTSTSKGFYNLTSNRKLSNYSVIDPSTTRMRCITKCLEDAKCRYVSYLPLNGECQQSEHVPADGVVTLDIVDGWESYSVPCDTGWYPLHDSCYAIEPEDMDWDDAKAACESSGAHLADIQTEEENAFLVDIIASVIYTLSIPEAGETTETPVNRYCNTGKVQIRTQNQDGCVHTRPHSYWIGGRDVHETRTFTWSDGTLVSAGYTDWNQGQPDNYGGSEFCVHLKKDFNYAWNDADCRSNGYRICEKHS